MNRKSFLLTMLDSAMGGTILMIPDEVFDSQYESRCLELVNRAKVILTFNDLYVKYKSSNVMEMIKQQMDELLEFIVENYDEAPPIEHIRKVCRGKHERNSLGDVDLVKVTYGIVPVAVLYTLYQNSIPYSPVAFKNWNTFYVKFSGVMALIWLDMERKIM
jgi:hypothetical protein